MERRVPSFAPSLVAAVAWGAMFPIAAAAFTHVDAFNVTVIRYGVAVLVFIVLLWRLESGAAIAFEGRFGRILILGALGFAGFNLLAYVGLEHIPAQNAALIVATTPLVTLIVRWLLDGVRPSRVQLTGVAVALIGVALVISRGHPTDVLDGVKPGEGLVLLGVIGWVLYTRGANEFTDWSPLRYTTLTAITGFGTILAVTAVADAAGWATLPSAGDVWAIGPNIAYIIFAGAVVAVLAWNLGVRRLGAANAALFMNLVPITTFVIEIARGYRPTAGELAGAALTISALVAVNVAGRRAADAAAARSRAADPAETDAPVPTARPVGAEVEVGAPTG